MKPNTHMQELFPDLPWSGDVCVLADWDNNCVRDRGWKFLTISDYSIPHTRVTFLDDENQLWTGWAGGEWGGILHCRLGKH
jgi:hypothetical protein